MGISQQDKCKWLENTKRFSVHSSVEEDTSNEAGREDGAGQSRRARPPAAVGRGQLGSGQHFQCALLRPRSSPRSAPLHSLAHCVVGCPQCSPQHSLFGKQKGGQRPSVGTGVCAVVEPHPGGLQSLKRARWACVCWQGSKFPRGCGSPCLKPFCARGGSRGVDTGRAGLAPRGAWVESICHRVLHAPRHFPQQAWNTPIL